jgi:hypothetical protein
MSDLARRGSREMKKVDMERRGSGEVKNVRLGEKREARSEECQTWGEEWRSEE